MSDHLLVEKNMKNSYIKSVVKMCDPFEDEREDNLFTQQKSAKCWVNTLYKT